jgi:hypothetical protein
MCEDQNMQFVDLTFFVLHFLMHPEAKQKINP